MTDDEPLTHPVDILTDLMTNCEYGCCDPRSKEELEDNPFIKSMRKACDEKINEGKSYD